MSVDTFDFIEYFDKGGKQQITWLWETDNRPCLDGRKGILLQLKTTLKPKIITNQSQVWYFLQFFSTITLRRSESLAEGTALDVTKGSFCLLIIWTSNHLEERNQTLLELKHSHLGILV